MWLLLTETVSIGSTGSLGIVPCFISPQTIDANASYSSVPQGRLELTISCHELSLHVGLDVAVEAIEASVYVSTAETHVPKNLLSNHRTQSLKRLCEI